MFQSVFNGLKNDLSYTTIHLSQRKVKTTDFYGEGITLRSRIMQDKNFVAYEYKTKTVKNNERAKTMDLYEAFGWEATEVNSAIGDNCVITLRRDRKIPHKQELIKLEKKAEEERAALDSLERSKTLGASIFAYIFGIISALVLGGGMSIVMNASGTVKNMVAGIVLGVVGIALCCITYPIYKKIVLKRTKDVTPAIDNGEEKLANVLEQGNDLLENREI